MAGHESLPALFESDGTDAFPSRPALLGGRCDTCGHTFFPMQHYGCEACGSADISSARLTGRGRLVASALVRIHTAPGREAPFVVGSIALEEGAFVRAILDVDPDEILIPGTIMTTRLVSEARPDRGVFDLRFAVAETGEI